MDFKYHHQGSIVILLALTQAARAWVADNLPQDRLAWGRDGVAIEPRYFDNVVRGIRDDGLTIKE